MVVVRKSEIFYQCGWTNDIATRDKEQRIFQQNEKINISSIVDQLQVCKDQGKNIDDDVKKRTGRQRLDDLINALNKLDTLGYRRSNQQRLFHKAFIGAFLKKIYGKDLYKDLPELLREYDLDELRTEVLVTTPRRFGKTFGTALFCAAVLCTLGGMEIAIYSTGRRASRKMLLLISKLVISLMGNTSCIKALNEEKLEVQGMHGEIATCFSYPSKVQIRHFFYLSFFLFFITKLSSILCNNQSQSHSIIMPNFPAGLFFV
jgi:hypothetical protein